MGIVGWENGETAGGLRDLYAFSRIDGTYLNVHIPIMV